MVYFIIFNGLLYYILRFTLLYLTVYFIIFNGLLYYF